MTAHDHQINFDAAALLKKWPSRANQPVTEGSWLEAYTIVDGTLDDCIRKFLTLPDNQHHLYEIRTAPTAVMPGPLIREVARLRDFL
jgi:hypothetical protein